MKTAVDYLEERMECGGITWEDIQQAKEMERQQMIDFYQKGYVDKEVGLSMRVKKLIKEE
jgi:hypothetical protein